jgi:VacB/RNase II family 3'-5' exoribonuclease
MFSSDQLSQLTDLKQNIRSSKDIAQGTVRATAGRFGFVTLEDGRDAFLNPEQMERVFPGDLVEVEVTKNKKEQYEARLEKLLSSPIAYLSGRYRIRGKGHFIATDANNFSRWIFIPPKNRAKCNEGDYASAKILQHPFKDGRAQAKILTKFGNEETPNIERLYAIGKHQLDTDFSAEVLKAADQLCQQSLHPEDKEDLRQDLRELNFVTIDSAATKDMDDALAIKKTSTGWTLSVAIAAPSADIDFNSPIDKAARKRAQTTYFADKPLTMLPEKLSIERYSLKQNEDRLSLVFQCEIESNGHLSAFAFIPAVIKSHAKLSYTHVAALLEGREYKPSPVLADPLEFKEQLTTLQNCSHALNGYRQKNNIVTDHGADFALYLDEKGKIKTIEKIERNCAHMIVEEAMLLTNRCAGDFLARHKLGLFVHHRGYREERRQDIETLLSEKTNSDISSTDKLENYIHTINTLQNNAEHKPLIAIQQRFLEASRVCQEPTPHFGLGFAHYATVTSPIRRYQDLYNQRVIHQLVSGEKPAALTDQQLEALRTNIRDSRDASQFMEKWLVCNYMKDKIDETFSATVSLLTNQGIGVRLEASGIEGFVPAAKADKKTEKTGDKVSFNNQRMELTWNESSILLDQVVSVTLVKIDDEKKKFEFSLNL